jgi:hypothetical protein
MLIGVHLKKKLDNLCSLARASFVRIEAQKIMSTKEISFFFSAALFQLLNSSSICDTSCREIF